MNPAPYFCMTDNFEILKKFLQEELGYARNEYYRVAAIQRGKDGAETNRVIMNWYLETQDDMCRYEPEIRGVCDLFGCRGYLYLERARSYDSILQMASLLSRRLIDRNYSKPWRVFEKAFGQLPGQDIWIVDVDKPEQLEATIEAVGNSILLTVPTVTGYHVVTRKFDTRRLPDHGPEVKKHRPTLLYYGV